MIKKLLIQNYALIEALELEFPSGLTIITGETGAGKSILLGALGLIMGNRADSRSLFDENKKCVVEAYFSIEKYGLASFFENNEISKVYLLSADADFLPVVNKFNLSHPSKKIVVVIPPGRYSSSFKSKIHITKSHISKSLFS